MPHLKLVVAAQLDTDLPRDRVINVLHFNDRGISSDEEQLCEDVATLFDTSWYSFTHPKITVTSYDQQGTQPIYPNAQFIKNPAAVAQPSTRPREIALCLSFYSGQNIPRKRGRVYLSMAGHGGGALGLRPDPTERTAAMALATGLAGIGGVDVDWEVWSVAGNAGYPVTHAWCDDEWDVQRRRGLKATTRSLATTGA
jgi:hypothetical protein